MTVPLDSIRAFHRALRKDMAAIDVAALNAARGTGKLDFVMKRYFFFNEVLVWYASVQQELHSALEKRSAAGGGSLPTGPPRPGLVI